VNSTLSVLGALGGLAVFAGAVVAVIRATFRQVTATEANTKVTQANTRAIEALEAKVAGLDRTVTVHNEKLTAQGREIGQLREAVDRNGRRP
jgi:hypothetical protein